MNNEVLEKLRDDLEIVIQDLENDVLGKKVNCVLFPKCKRKVIVYMVDVWRKKRRIGYLKWCERHYEKMVLFSADAIKRGFK